MKIEFDFEHICYDCGKRLGVLIPVQADKVRGVYVVKVQPCTCSTSKAPNKQYQNIDKSTSDI